MSDTRPARILLAEDHPMFRDGLVALLNVDPDFEVVGATATGHEVVDLADQLEPDVVIMDLGLPGLHGAVATREILARHPEIRVLVLTMHDDDASLFGALRAGARGFLLKTASPTDIYRAVRAVSAGDAFYGEAVADRLISHFATPLRTSAATFPQLTEREHEVLELVAQGKANFEIARRLLLSEKTVRNHLSNILTKLAVTTRAEAIVTARNAGLGGPDAPRRS